MDPNVCLCHKVALKQKKNMLCITMSMTLKDVSRTFFWVGVAEEGRQAVPVSILYHRGVFLLSINRRVLILLL